MIQRYVVERTARSTTHLVPVTDYYQGHTQHLCRSEDVAELEAQIPAPGTFAWAITHIMNGGRGVRRACWDEGDTVYLNKLGIITIENWIIPVLRKPFLPLVNKGQLIATDWEVVE